MLAKLKTFSLVGIDALPVEVEVDVSPAGLPKTLLVGLPEAAVKESTHRVERAMVNSGFQRPQSRVVINMAPACSRLSQWPRPAPSSEGRATLRKLTAPLGRVRCWRVLESALGGNGMTTIDDLILRMRRIYAAIGETIDTDISKYRATVLQNDRMTFMWQDFRGGLSREQLLNLAFSLVYNVFILRDHLRNWASGRFGSDHQVMDFFKKSMPLKTVADLCNADKHCYPPDKPWTDLVPRLGEVTRPLQITAKPGAGWFMFTVGADGRPTTHGEGEAKVVLSADVVDKDGNRIGDLVEIVEKAVTDWEKLLLEFGIEA